MTGESWAAVRLWATRDMRVRWKGLIALGLIAGVTAGLALAALAGAQETGTVLHRLRERTNASDAIVFSSQVGESHPHWRKLRHRPEVEHLAVWSLVFGNLDGDPEGLLFTPVDDTWMQSQDTPVIVAGRAVDPTSDDEVMVADGAAKKYHIHVGDTVPFIPYTPAENESSQGTIQGTKDLKGPHLTMRVVGIMRTPLEPLFVADGFVVASPGLIRQHHDVEFHENAVVQLRDPGRDELTFEKHVNSDVAPGAPVLDLHAVSRRVTTTTDVERAALGLLAAAITLAGLVLAGQVVGRSASTVAPDARILRAVGLRRGAVARAATLAHAPAVVTAVAACLATAVLTSRWLPLGEAAKLEPDPGFHLHTAIVLPGTTFLLVLLVGAVYLTAWSVAGPPRPVTIDERHGVASWVRRHASAPVGIGATLALRRGRGPNGLPVRPALLGAVVGVLGVASALTMDAGIRETLDHPERAGVAWDAQAMPGRQSDYTERGFSAAFVAAVGKVPGIVDEVQIDRAVIPAEGTKGIPSFAVRPVGSSQVKHKISLVVLDGRAPTRAGEVAIGPETARALDLRIGDKVSAGAPARSLRVVGTALFPSDVHAEFDEGLWMTPEDLDVVSPSDGSQERLIAVRFTDGATSKNLAALQKAADPFEGFSGSVEVPPEFVNLKSVLPLPKLLAAFLALLALAALLHVLVTTTRVRAGEFAVLRALGFTRGSMRLVVNVQAGAVFLAGLTLGTPLGVALGRVGWSQIAQRVPLEEVPPFAAVAILALVPITLVVGQMLAYGPGRRVTRLRVAEVLRTE